MFSFFKPKWQHRNPKIRIEAINSQELDKDMIVKMAQTDPEIDVRIAAFQHISELNLLYAILLQEPCDHGKKVILRQISLQFLKEDQVEYAINNFMGTTVRRDFPMADLLMVCEESKLKQLLFPKINLKKDLPKLVDSNYLFSVDELLLVDDLGLLNSLIKKSNITDKKVLAHLKDALRKHEEAERLVQLKTTLLNRYQAIAESEQLVPLNVFSEIEKEWNEHQLGDEHLEYKDIYLARHNAYNAQRQARLSELNAIEIGIQNDEFENLGEVLVNLKSLYEDVVFSLKEKSQIQGLMAQIDAKITKIQQQLKLEPASKMQVDKVLPEKTEKLKPRKTAEFDRNEFKHNLKKLEQLMDEGHLQAAEQLNDELSSLLKALGNSKDSVHFNRVLKQVAQPLYDQLDTARWGIYQSLELLCDKAEQLSDEASIELVSIKLKALREDWNTSKKGIAHVPHRLYQRFESACKSAHQRLVDVRNLDNTARAVYLAEAQELLDTLVEFVAQIDWQQPNWESLTETRQKFLQEWNRYLDQYSTDGTLSYGAPLFLAKDKYKLEKSMRQILKPLDTAMQNERKQERKRREDEIALLQQLLENGDIKEAVDKAKEFNRHFNPTVRSKGHDENLLWKQLRVVNDQIFALREEYVSAEEGERSENAQQKRSLLNELKALKDSVNHNSQIHLVELALKAIEDRWRDIGVVAKRDYAKFENDFKNLLQKIQKSLHVIELEKMQAARQQLLDASMAIGQLESCIHQHESIEISAQLYDVANGALKKRLKCLEQIQVGQESAQQYLQEQLSESEELAKKLVLMREILLDQSSPEEDQDLRLALQVQILEQAMNDNRKNHDKTQQLKEIDVTWLENVVGIVPDSLYQRFK